MENTTQNPPALTLNDLAVLRNVVEVAISRGTFKADEISVVGQTYDKLKAWLDLVAAQQAQSQELPNLQRKNQLLPSRKEKNNGISKTRR